MASNPRLRRLEAQQTPVAKKVLDCTPYEEFWTSSQIATELYRQGRRLDKSIVEGCLASLVRDGLLRRAGEGFQRIRLDEEDNPVHNVTRRIVETPAPGEEAPKTAQSRLYSLVKQLADMSRLLAGAVDELENTILALEEEQAANSQELQKLQRLKLALRELD